MLMIIGFFSVVGFALILIGLLLIARAIGIVNRNSPFFTYPIRIGGFLVILGLLIMVSSIILKISPNPRP
jgi:hypothetical protein